MPNPSAKLALTTERGEFQKGWQDVNLPRFQRYHEDITDFAKWIRHEEDPRFSFEHDLIVQETLLKISGLASN